MATSASTSNTAPAAGTDVPVHAHSNRRHSAPDAAQTHKDYKRVIRDLRKGGIVTSMGIKQALSKGALGSNIQTFEEDKKDENVDESKELKKQQMYRRLKAPSLGKAVENMIRSDSDALHVLTGPSNSEKQIKPNAADKNSFHRRQRPSLVRNADSVEKGISMNSNLYNLETPEEKEQKSSGGFLKKIEAAFRLSSLQKEIDEGRR